MKKAVFPFSTVVCNPNQVRLKAFKAMLFSHREKLHSS